MAKKPDMEALERLRDALDDVLATADAANPTTTKRIREGLAEHAKALEAARSSSDPVRMPRVSFDPSDPKTIGRMVSLALIAQPRIPLANIPQAYGSGVYALYYHGDHPLYAKIRDTETPIYVGKADPQNPDASDSREQGSKLTGRLKEHADTIAVSEAYADKMKLAPPLYPIRLADFTCRRLVCATNAQLVAEKHLIRMFWPVWNSETKACWGMAKHGDAASTRKNKRSPWHVVHPGKASDLATSLVDALSPAEIAQRIADTASRVPERTNHAMLLEEMLAAFRQDDGVQPNDDDEPPVGDAALGPDADED